MTGTTMTGTTMTTTMTGTTTDEHVLKEGQGRCDRVRSFRGGELRYRGCCRRAPGLKRL